MATKKKRLAGRAVKKRASRKGAAAKRAAPKKRSSAARRRATGRQSPRKKRASKSAAVRRKAHKVDEARHQLIEAEKDLAAEELPKLIHPATKKRGADPHVPSKIKRKRPSNPKEQKLEQGLEESMAGYGAASGRSLFGIAYLGERPFLAALSSGRSNSNGHTHEHWSPVGESNRTSGREVGETNHLHQRRRAQTADSSPSSRAAFSRAEIASLASFRASITSVSQRSRSRSKSAWLLAARTSRHCFSTSSLASSPSSCSTRAFRSSLSDR